MTLVFGALAPKLHAQLQMPQRKLRYLQDCADGITNLAVGQLLTEAEVKRARRRLIKRIQQTFFSHSRAEEKA